MTLMILHQSFNSNNRLFKSLEVIAGVNFAQYRYLLMLATVINPNRLVYTINGLQAKVLVIQKPFEKFLDY